MLQRIQTVYWLLSVLCLGILISGVDLITFRKEKMEYNLSLYGLKHLRNDGEIIKEFSRFDYLLVVLLIVLTLITIYSFKNLKKQLNLAKWLISLNLILVLILVLFSYTGMVVSKPESIKINFWFSLFLISLVFSILAFLGVKKDKSLLDSVDRIR